MIALKLLTLNTHAWLEEQQMEKITQLAAFINEREFDVIALQEVNQSIMETAVSPERLTHYVCADQEAVIKQDNYAYVLLQQLSASYYWTWVPVHVGYGKYDEGVAILSRTPITDTISDYVSVVRDYANYRTRKVVGIKTSAADGEAWFVSGHFGWWHDEEEPFQAQWDRTESVLTRCGTTRVFAMGDFNNAAGVREEGYDYVLGKGWHDLYSDAMVRDEGDTVVKAIAGWENNQTQLRIDYIFSNTRVQAQSSTVVLNGKNGAVVSDHFGVAVEI